jgi:FKBP-type peptidyl-prolyl cis-trans isomerase
MQNQKGNISVIVSFIIVVGLIGLVVYSLMNKPVKVDPLEGITKTENTANKDVSNPTSPKEESVTTPTKVMNPNAKLLTNFKPVSEVTKLEKIDVVVGSGEEVKAGATVSVHYTGAVAATGVIFQSSKDFGTTPVTFPLANVIKGWTDGIPGMKVGGTRRLIIPAAEAYGATPPPGSGIPANAALVFDVELISISK